MRTRTPQSRSPNRKAPFLPLSLLDRQHRRSIVITVEEDASRKTRLVFISHSSADTWVAKQVAREIEARGATPFLDEAEVDAGADFEEDILNFLERAHELVVLLLLGRSRDRMSRLRLELLGVAGSPLLHCCSGSRRLSCKLGRGSRFF